MNDDEDVLNKYLQNINHFYIIRLINWLKVTLTTRIGSVAWQHVFSGRMVISLGQILPTFRPELNIENYKIHNWLMPAIETRICRLNE